MKSIVVISGKGGVGKTIVASNIVRMLRDLNFSVGAVDADIDNPNLADFLGVTGSITIASTGLDTKKLVPVAADGIRVFSMSLVNRDSPIGILGETSGDLVRDVIRFGEWNTEFLVVDLPAGSGDEMRSAIRAVADTLVGTVIVTQPAHLTVAERIIKLHLLNGIPCLGIVENMSKFVCEHGSEYNIFGRPGAMALAQKYNIEFLGEIPIVPTVTTSNKVIPQDHNEPLQRAVDKAIEATPIIPGFLQRTSEKVKTYTREHLAPLLLDLLIALNKEVPIKDIQKQFNYPGGRIVRLNLYDDAMEKILSQENFKVDNGRLLPVPKPEGSGREAFEKAIEQDGVKIHASLRAVIEALSGIKKVSGVEVPYDLQTAWLNGDIIAKGKQGDMIRTLEFVLAVWEYVREKKPPIIMEIVRKMT